MPNTTHLKNNLKLLTTVKGRGKELGGCACATSQFFQLSFAVLQYFSIFCTLLSNPAILAALSHLMSLSKFGFNTAAGGCMGGWLVTGAAEVDGVGATEAPWTPD
ncbi:hypothetical protein NDU88_004007, partial [Pleurodeles waltl]